MDDHEFQSSITELYKAGEFNNRGLGTYCYEYPMVGRDDIFKLFCFHFASIDDEEYWNEHSMLNLIGLIDGKSILPDTIISINKGNTHKLLYDIKNIDIAKNRVDKANDSGFPPVIYKFLRNLTEIFTIYNNKSLNIKPGSILFIIDVDIQKDPPLIDAIIFNEIKISEESFNSVEIYDIPYINKYQAYIYDICKISFSEALELLDYLRKHFMHKPFQNLVDFYNVSHSKKSDGEWINEIRLEDD